jgi:hypothetical protein
MGNLFLTHCFHNRVEVSNDQSRYILVAVVVKDYIGQMESVQSLRWSMVHRKIRDLVLVR